MELKEFIESTITQIAEAVSNLNENLEDTEVNPVIHDFSGYDISKKNGSPKAINIEFNLNISVENKTGGKASIGVLSSMIGIGAQEEKEKANGEINNIKFAIPVVLPTKIGR